MCICHKQSCDIRKGIGEKSEEFNIVINAYTLLCCKRVLEKLRIVVNKTVNCWWRDKNVFLQ